MRNSSILSLFLVICYAASSYSADEGESTESPWVRYDANTVVIRPSDKLYRAKFFVTSDGRVDMVTIVARDGSPIPDEIEVNQDDYARVVLADLKVSEPKEGDQKEITLERGGEKYVVLYDEDFGNAELVEANAPRVETRGPKTKLAKKIGKKVLKKIMKMIENELKEVWVESEE